MLNPIMDCSLADEAVRKKLGINVEPADVRLQPGVEDGYEWSRYQGGKIYLMKLYL
jgi:hypothetical protein